LVNSFKIILKPKFSRNNCKRVKGLGFTRFLAWGLDLETLSMSKWYCNKWSGIFLWCNSNKQFF